MRPLVALLVAAGVVLGAEGDDAPASAATFVLTEDGLNSLPHLFADAIISPAVKQANAEMRQELRGKVAELLRSLCIKDTSIVVCTELLDSQQGGAVDDGTKLCAGGGSDLCHIPPNIVFDITLTDLHGAMGPSGEDYFGLQSYVPPSVKLSLEPCHKGPLKCLLSGEVGTVKMIAQIELGAKIGVRGSGLHNSFIGMPGVLEMCCAGISVCGHVLGIPIPCPWVGKCSCAHVGHDCGCSGVCDSPITVSARTPLVIDAVLYRKDKKYSATLQNIAMPQLGGTGPGGIKINLGCLQTMIDSVVHNKPLGWLGDFGIWVWDLFGHDLAHKIGQLDSMIGSMIAMLEQKLGDAVNDFLAEQIPVEAQATCGEECNLPKGVTIGYAVNNMTIHGDSAGNYLEALLSAEICADKSLLPRGRSGLSEKVCFGKDHIDTAPPLKSVRPFSSTTPVGSKMLTGIRVSSSLMDGIAWAMGEAGLFLTSSTVDVLDANLEFNVSWADLNHPPRLGISQTDSVAFEWSKGFVRVLCHSMPSAVDMMDFRWSNLVGNGTIASSHGGCGSDPSTCECGGGDTTLCGTHSMVCEGYDSEHACNSARNPVGRCVWSPDASPDAPCMRNTCVSPQISSFDVSQSNLQLVAPQLPLPNEFVTKLMETTLVEGMIQMNNVLDDNSFCVPPSVNQYLGSSPMTALFNQHIATDDQLGFLQLASYCGLGFTKCVATTFDQSLPQDTSLTVAASEDAESYQIQLPRQPLLTESTDTAIEFSPEIRDHTSTYMQDGRMYRYGAFIMTFGSGCKNPCTLATGSLRENGTIGGQCIATYFKNGECLDSIKRSCRGGSYVEEQFEFDDCTGESTANATTQPAGICSNNSLPGNMQVGLLAICPTQLPDPPPPPGQIWDIVATVSVAALLTVGLGVLAARYGNIAPLQRCCNAASDTVRTTLPAVVAFCSRSVQVAQVISTAVSNSAAAMANPCVAMIREACAWLRTWCAEVTLSAWDRGTAYASNMAAFCVWATTLRPRSLGSITAFDWAELALNVCAAGGFGAHGLLWLYRDPFAAFNRNVFQEIGFGGSVANISTSDLINASPVQEHFTQWSLTGKIVQAVGCGVILLATFLGFIEQLRPISRATIHTAAFVMVALGQVSMMLVPPFLFDLAVAVNENQTDADSMLSDPAFRSDANDGLSLALDGVALTFISSLFMFLLHGLAPGVFLGSCLFGAYLISLRSKSKPDKTGSTFDRFTSDLTSGVGSSSRVSMMSERLLPGNGRSALDLAWAQTQSSESGGSVRSSFTSGVTEGSSRTWDLAGARPLDGHVQMPLKLLQQQQPRVRILNWIVALGAPCGGCLPAIIVYQSLGAEGWWSGCFLFCWLLPCALMGPLIFVLKSNGNDSWGAKALVLTATLYAALYTGATLAILFGLREKAVAGGFTEFTIEFPLSTFISSVLGCMALTNSYLKRALLVDATRQHMARPLLSTSQEVPSVESDGTIDTDSALLRGPATMAAARDAAVRDARGWAESACRCGKTCRDLALGWLRESDEREDPRRFGRRLPYRRISLAFGTGLTCWVLWRNFQESNGFVNTWQLDAIKQTLEEADHGLQWPEGNATILDEAVDTYGMYSKHQFAVESSALLLLLCACWCDWAVRDKRGLRFSRFFGFAGLAVMFFASLVPAAPNYLRITKLDTLCPCCAQQFNFLVSTLLQDMVGIFCSGLFALKLVPVLLIVVPSIVRACTLILYDDITSEKKRNRQINAADFNSPTERQLHAEAMQSYIDPAFSRSNVHSVFSLSSLLTPIFTAIPMTVLVQLMRRPQFNRPAFVFLWMTNTTFMSATIAVFYLVPMLLGLLQCKTTESVSRRYALWLLMYFGPLVLLTGREIYVLGYWKQAMDDLQSNWITYLCEVICEVLVANVILSDLMYSNLYVEHAKKKHLSRGGVRRLPVAQVLLLLVCPLLLCVGGMWTILDKLKYFDPPERVHVQVSTDTNGHVGGQCHFDGH